MARSHNRLFGWFGRLFGSLAHAPDSDGDLLDRFTTQRDEQAFREIVQRHGPMVLATCRRIVRDEHEAEDCFQAAFVVLARKAGSIRKQESLGGWLHRVAGHIALEARARAAKQHALERAAAEIARDDPSDDSSLELGRVLDDELRQLPDKYREPLILCYLQGKTHLVAAQELGWPSGTMSRRLERGQELLRGRLLRRGIALSGIALGAALAGEAASAAVPAALSAATAKAALLTTWGTAAVGLGTAKTVAVALVIAGAVAVPMVVQLTRDEPAPVVEPAGEPETDWGQAVHGLRLRCGTDRVAYRADSDLIRVTFAMHNVSQTLQDVTFFTEAEEFTDVRLTDEDGVEHFVAGDRKTLPQARRRRGKLQADAVERVDMILDPSRIAGGLKPGRYRLRGLFRRQPAGEEPLTVADLRLESNETSFVVLPASAERQPAGSQVDGCALSLVGRRTTWKPGDGPLSFAVVLERSTDDLTALRFLQANKLGLYYHLEITDPKGHVSQALQPAESAGADPRIDPLAHRQLMFLQLEHVPVGKRLGERLDLDPSGEGEREPGLVPVVRRLRWPAGRYSVRAVYQLKERDRLLHPDRQIRLVSNSVEVRIDD